MRTRVKGALLLTSAVLAVPAAVIGLAVSASATPADCTAQTVRTSSSGIPYVTVTRTCASGTGQYRTYIKCFHHLHGIPTYLNKYGEWTNASPYESSVST